MRFRRTLCGRAVVCRTDELSGSAFSRIKMSLKWTEEASSGAGFGGCGLHSSLGPSSPASGSARVLLTAGRLVVVRPETLCLFASGHMICSDCDGERLCGASRFGCWTSAAGSAPPPEPEADLDGCEGETEGSVWARRTEEDGTQGLECRRVWMPAHTRSACPSAGKRRASHEQLEVSIPCASRAAVAVRHRRTSTLGAQLVDEVSEERDEDEEDAECGLEMVSTPHASWNSPHADEHCARLASRLAVGSERAMQSPSIWKHVGEVGGEYRHGGLHSTEYSTVCGNRIEWPDISSDTCGAVILIIQNRIHHFENIRFIE